MRCVKRRGRGTKGARREGSAMRPPGCAPGTGGRGAGNGRARGFVGAKSKGEFSPQNALLMS